MENMQGKVAVITGASSGIGRAIALALATRGAILALVGRNMGSLQAMAALAGGVVVKCFACDLGIDEEIERLAMQVRGEFGRVDLLVHSAGVLALGRMQTFSVAQLDRMYQINLRAPFLLTQALAPQLVASRGQIVFVNSPAALSASPQKGAYAATKHGLVAIADAFRDELEADGVRVISVYPGRTDTPMQETVRQFEDKPYDPAVLLRPEDVASMVLHTLELPRGAVVKNITVLPSRANGGVK